MATQQVGMYKVQVSGSLARLKIQSQDDTYGLGLSSTQTKFGFLKDGKLLTGFALKAELDKPVWGQNGDQKFIDLIMPIPEKVSKFIQSPDGQFEWHDFDPDDESTYPATEVPETGHAGEYAGRGWECEDATYPGQYYQNMHWRGESSVETWGYLNIYRYRQQKVAGWETPMIPNPDFPIVEEQRRIAMDSYIQLVHDSGLVPIGSYKFQGLPLNTSTITYKWRIDSPAITAATPRIDPDPNHKLAQNGTGWKMIFAPLRNPEMYSYNTSSGMKTVDLYESAWTTRVIQPTENGATPQYRIDLLTK